MQVLIPAAGKGTRLRPHTYVTPKSLLPVAGKPLLHHIIDRIADLPISRLILIVGYLGDAIREDIQKAYSHLPLYFVEQPEQQGLGHSVWVARSHLDPDEPLLIILGDTIADVEWQQFAIADTSLLGVRSVDDPRRFGVVKLRDDGTIEYVIEKPEHPPSSLAIVGIYYITRPQRLLEALDTLIQQDTRTRGEYQLTDALQLMLERGETIRPLPVAEWYDCGNLPMWLATNQTLLDRVAPPPPPVSEDVQIRPPVWIDPSATLRNAVVGPYVTIGASSTITNSTIQNTIVGNNVRIEHSTLADSVIGDRSQVRNIHGSVNICADSTVTNTVEQNDHSSQ